MKRVPSTVSGPQRCRTGVAPGEAARGTGAEGDRRRFLLGGAMGVSGLLALPALARESFQSIDITGATYGRDFRLSDPDGRVRSLADFRGKVVLLFFGFTQAVNHAFDPLGHPRLAIKHVQSAQSVAADVQLLLKDG